MSKSTLFNLNSLQYRFTISCITFDLVTQAWMCRNCTLGFLKHIFYELICNFQNPPKRTFENKKYILQRFCSRSDGGRGSSSRRLLIGWLHQRAALIGCAIAKKFAAGLWSGPPRRIHPRAQHPREFTDLIRIESARRGEHLKRNQSEPCLTFARKRHHS